MKMNNLLILAIILTNFSCKTKVANSVKDIELRKVEIRFVNMSITTPVLVNCQNFEQYFAEDKIYKRVYTNAQEWGSIINEINSLIESGEKTNEIPDVRMKIELRYESNSSLVCIGTLLTSIDGTTYINNSSFKDFINTNFQE